MTRLRHIAAFLDIASAPFRAAPVRRYPDPAIFDREAFDAGVREIEASHARSIALADAIEAALPQYPDEVARRVGWPVGAERAVSGRDG